MKRDKLLIAVTFGLLLTGTASAAPGTRTYSGKELNHIAFPYRWARIRDVLY